MEFDLDKMYCGKIKRGDIFLVDVGNGAERVVVVISPCINECCYNIWGERVEEFRSVFGKDADSILIERDKKIYLNLIKANYIQLGHAGIKEKNIDYFPFCTSCDKNRFYSFRRDGDIIGEVMGYIMMKSNN